MSVRGAKRGKSSHEQKAVRGSGGGMLFVKAISGQTPVRGAAGGLLFLGPHKTKKAKRVKRVQVAKPGFEHLSRSGKR